MPYSRDLKLAAVSFVDASGGGSLCSPLESEHDKQSSLSFSGTAWPSTNKETSRVPY